MVEIIWASAMEYSWSAPKAAKNGEEKALLLKTSVSAGTRSSRRDHRHFPLLEV